MIWKLQKKTLLPLQIFGYGITLCIGIIIVLTTLNIYYDIQPILEKETDVFGNVYIGQGIRKTELAYEIDKIEMVGHYAIRIYWKDNHNSGIYTFNLLQKLNNAIEN